MAKYTVTTRSILYEYHEVEAENEEQVREIYESNAWYGVTRHNSHTEDTDIYDITPNEEQN